MLKAIQEPKTAPQTVRKNIPEFKDVPKEVRVTKLQ